MPDSPLPSAAADPVTRYQERLGPPLLWWVLGPAMALGAAAGVHGGQSDARYLLPYLLLPGPVLLALLLLARQHVRVTGEALHLPNARAPLSAFGPPVLLDSEQLRQWRGPRAHRDAWVCARPWHRQAVLLPVTDPDDDTPYWLIGSREPARLAAAVRS